MKIKKKYVVFSKKYKSYFTGSNKNIDAFHENKKRAKKFNNSGEANIHINRLIKRCNDTFKVIKQK